MIDAQLKAALHTFLQSSKRITVLTGAGISAESGIPTFRGPEGYWTIGSKDYHPQEMATQAMFRQKPDEVWKWYLYRRGVCHQAQPNAGHLALVQMEKQFGERFTLITQNVDGLHLRAGNSPERTYQIHGNIDYMRCVEQCSTVVYPIPEAIPGKAKGEELTTQDHELLRCPHCGGKTRPHILWFDENYDEAYYRFESSLAVAQQTELLIVVGTSGATNLPNHVVRQVLQQGGLIIDINLEENPFSKMAVNSKRGYFLQQPSGVALPELMTVLEA